METKIAFSPRGNKVLLRADFEVSTLNILNNEEINKIPAKAYTVMAVAENVKGLNIGDKVKTGKRLYSYSYSNAGWYSNTCS